METAAKHLAWAGSLVACVYLATSHNWIPVQLQIVANAPNQPAAGLASTIPAVAPANLTTGVSAPAAQGAAPSQTLASPQVVQPAMPPAANVAYATIEDAKVARQVMELLGKLDAVADIPDGTPVGQVATIFFDPRCPYCHAAFTALHGRVAARWVPIVVLGEPEAGNRMAAAILSSPDRVAALKGAFDAKTTPAAAASPEHTAKLAENKEAFAAIFAAAPHLRPGVPTMFVPRPDGRLAIMVGYEAGDDAKLLAVLTGS